MGNHWIRQREIYNLPVAIEDRGNMSFLVYDSVMLKDVAMLREYWLWAWEGGEICDGTYAGITREIDRALEDENQPQGS